MNNVIDISTREKTDRAPTFTERVIEDFVRYCDDNNIAVSLCLIEDNQQSLYTGAHSYTEDMLGLLEVAQSRVSRYMDAPMGESDDDEDTGA